MIARDITAVIEAHLPDFPSRPYVEYRCTRGHASLAHAGSSVQCHCRRPMKAGLAGSSHAAVPSPR